MGVFQDSNKDDQIISSSYKATKAARYIHTLIDYCLNPALKKSMDICIGCGIGICTGTIMITKVGMRGKESDETTENETGIVWVGSSADFLLISSTSSRAFSCVSAKISCINEFSE